MRTWEGYKEAINVEIGYATVGEIDLVDILGMVDGDVDIWEEFEMHTSPRVVADMILRAAGYPL